MLSLDNILFLPALTSIIFFIAGVITYHFPPKKINYFYGYRTISSMKSQDRWNFAQKYSSIQMIKTAIVMFLLSISFSIFSLPEKINLFIGIIILLTAIIFMFYKIEKAIKVNFPKI